MNKTILISIGLICALVSAAGIMWYANAPLWLETSVSLVSPEYEATTFPEYEKNSSLMDTSDCRLPVWIKITPDRMSFDAPSAAHQAEAKLIEKLALDYLTRKPDNSQPQRTYIKVRGRLEFSSDFKSAKYTLNRYYASDAGHHDTVLLLKKENTWLLSSYVTSGGWFACHSNCH